NKDLIQNFILLLAPFAPYLSEELFSHLLVGADKTWSSEDSVHLQTWPSWDESLLVSDVVEIPIQFNGKVKLRLDVPQAVAKDRAQLEQFVSTHPEVLSKIGNGVLQKMVVVPERLVNLLVS